MRQTKMIEWMENVEKAISRIMADKVYTSAEFKRERDNFHVSITITYISHYHSLYSILSLFIQWELYPCFMKHWFLGTLQRS